MSAAEQASVVASTLLAWLALERLSPFDAYAQAVGTVMLIIALLQWLSSHYGDARALRIVALVSLLTGIGWFTAHPRAQRGAEDVPLLPALVAVRLLGMNVWGGRAVRVSGPGAVVAAVAAFRARGVAVIASAFAYCAWLALRAARLEGNVGHLYVAVAFATYPLMFGLYVALPQAMAGFEMAYNAAVPGMIVDMMMLAVGLIRAHQRSEAELMRRIQAEDSLRQLNATLEERVVASTLESLNRNVSHDLRDPLACVSGLAMLSSQALEREDTVRARVYLATLRGQAGQMTGMVQGLLQWSRVAEAAPRREHRPLGRCVDEALAHAIAPAGACRRLSAPVAAAMDRVQLQLQPLPDCAVDAELMRLVFVNLIGHALEVHRSACRARRGGGGPAHHRIGHGSVCAGRRPGPAAWTRRRAVQADRAAVHGERVHGTGVGLTLVRRIVAAHGGHI